jgi:hypothetical protein
LMGSRLKQVDVPSIGIFVFHSHSKRHFSIHVGTLPFFSVGRSSIFVRLNKLLLLFCVHKSRRLKIEHIFLPFRIKLIRWGVFGVIIARINIESCLCHFLIFEF